MTETEAVVLHQLVKLGEQMLESDGSLIPTLFVEHGDALFDVIGIADMPGTSAERARLMRELGEQYRGKDVERVFFVGDAYTKRLQAPEDFASGTPLADDPKAIECIVGVQLKRSGEAVVIIHPYEREVTLEATRIIWQEAMEHTGPDDRYSGMVGTFLAAATGGTP